MARIFITGSADGLGQLAAELLVEQGHKVVLHARNGERAKHALHKVPGAEEALIADLSDIEETKQLAEHVNRIGDFDAIIHNAGVYRASGTMITSVNILAPYVLTCLIQRPKRLIYLSSSSHLSGHPNLDNLKNDQNSITYSDSKLHNVMLSMAVARKWPEVFSNALDPGWVPTKMGGEGAPDDLEKGFQTQVWLAVSNDENAKVSGQYFFHKKASRYRSEANDVTMQEKFLSICEQLTGVKFPDEKT
jgi:NAD(P)-dependent dehydrogenase (short-subunit alcohol dehydrogenase family)